MKVTQVSDVANGLLIYLELNSTFELFIVDMNHRTYLNPELVM
jgi:hypothetical protein